MQDAPRGMSPACRVPLASASSPLVPGMHGLHELPYSHNRVSPPSAHTTSYVIRHVPHAMRNYFVHWAHDTSSTLLQYTRCPRGRTSLYPSSWLFVDRRDRSATVYYVSERDARRGPVAKLAWRPSTQRFVRLLRKQAACSLERTAEHGTHTYTLGDYRLLSTPVKLWLECTSTLGAVSATGRTVVTAGGQLRLLTCDRESTEGRLDDH